MSSSHYQAGRIAAAIEKATIPLTPGCLSNAATLPDRLHVILRHVWTRAKDNPIVQSLIADWTPEPALSMADQGAFYIGYYHQRAEK